MLQKFNRLLALAAALFAGVGLYAEKPVGQEPQRRTAAPTVGGDQNAIIERAVRRRTMMEARKAAAERNRPAREAALAAAKAKVQAAVKATGSVPLYKAPKEAALAPAPLGTMDPQGTPHYMDGLIPNYANTDPIRKFVDTLPGLGSAQANNLGNYIPVGVPDRTTYPGSDYYSIDLIDYTQKLHSDLPKATKLRGYIQHGAPGVNTLNGTASNYLGPVIVAKRDRPVRVKFSNLLSQGALGNLPLPMDSSLMGSGAGPGGTTFTQNRAELHLHGGLNPWISDGTPHQWFTPAGDPTANKKGVSFRNVPDMIGVDGVLDQPGDGVGTYFYTNQQSGRFMFYHDHTFGLTRLNVYMGEAAGYMIVDPVETKLINAGIIPSQGAALPISEDPWDATVGVNSLFNGNSVYTYGIPLVFQDKTFVPNEATSLVWQDPTWDLANWGVEGDLWYPHVYMPNQNPDDLTGANAMGRWDYGPWFWPPLPVATTDVTPVNTIPKAHGPIPGSGDPLDGNGGLTYPGTPNPSLTPEAFMDTPVVNGTAYPTVTVKPQAYRFRMLNAANDRPFSFAFYTADPLADTEVKMIEASPLNAAAAATFLAAKYGTVPTDPALPVWPKDGRAGGVVDFTTMGPDIIQIGNESGFLPAPVVFRSQPTTYNYNRRDIVVLDVERHALWLTPAERADVIVDFSAFAGQTLILYNDMLAPVPAFDVRYDYYTGPDADQTATGGAPAAAPGYGRNTRTLMQFKVTNDAAVPFDIAPLQAAFASSATSNGAFKASQHPPIIPQTFYNEAMNTAYATDTYARIQDNSKTYNRTENGDLVTMPFQPKAIQELFELDYGRMNATLGVELPLTNFNNQTTIPIGYSELPTEFVTDGTTQIWKITHNGVDTHPVHFHLFDVQIMNRVGWDGAVRFPEENELGWKETVRMKPLEDIVVAFRPISPRLPFSLAGNTSQRVLDPTKDANALVPSTDILAGALNQGNLGNIVQVSNNNNGALYDYGWEYVWHCHILGHEENDFMRPLVLTVAGTVPTAASNLAATFVSSSLVTLTWADNANNENGYRIERKDGVGGTWTAVGTVVPDTRSFTDLTFAAAAGVINYYRVIGWNQAGDSLPSNTVSNALTVSGTILTAAAAPVSGVTVAFTGGIASVTTDGSGFYTQDVAAGYTGTVTPSLANYIFSPVNASLTAIAVNTTANFTALPQITISGQATDLGVGVAGVTITYTGGTTTTDVNGNYSFSVTQPYTGTVSASLASYTFAPASITFTNRTTNATGQNFAAQYITISGLTYSSPSPNYVAISGATVTATGGYAPVTSIASGAYSISVRTPYTGTVTPSKAGINSWSPSYTYTNLSTNITAQNFQGFGGTFTISGQVTNAGVGLDGVTITFSNGGPVVTTAGGGLYTATVNSGYTGAVSASATGYTFSAPLNISTVVANQTGKNFTVLTQTISGTVTKNGAGVQNVLITFSNGAGTATTNGSGNYSRTVPAGYTGTATATPTNYQLSAPIAFTGLSASATGQNFTVTAVRITGIIYFQVSTNPRPGVTLTASNGGGTAVSGANGIYNLYVPLNWTGTVTPSGGGYGAFTPATRTYATAITTPQTGQNYRTAL